jgi:hypothetical protein
MNILLDLINLLEASSYANSNRWNDLQLKGLDKDKVLKTIPYLEKWVKEIKKDEFANTIGHRLPSRILDEVPDDLQDYIDGALYILGMEDSGGNKLTYLVMS